MILGGPMEQPEVCIKSRRNPH